MKKLLSTLLLTVFCLGTSQAQQSIIPQPQNIKTLDTQGFALSPKTTLQYNTPELDNVAAMLRKSLALPLTKVDKKGGITFNIIDDKSLGKEGYTLTVGKKSIVINAAYPAGIFYGTQTLLQLFDPHTTPQTYNVAAVDIRDVPTFEWRGMMLDVSRHWFDTQEVKRFIDNMATYKLNTFHWHLTDDQGWRIEIKSRPELTQKAALRAPRVGQWWKREPQQPGEVATYGGYYTQEQIREVVEYARERFIRVIPEIDVPGHSLAALVTYPELACIKAPTTINVGNTFYGSDENSLCAGNPESYTFMKDVLSEVAQLFPDEYLHIGGDECFKGFWEKCPKCQALMKKEGLENTHRLQSYFILQMQDILDSLGKRMIGWDEIAEGGLAPKATVMSWRGSEAGITAAKAGHHVVMTPNNNCYIDLYQGEPSVEPDTYSMCRLKDSYSLEVVPEGIDSAYVLGGQATLWAESVPTMHHAEYMAWPRGWALSEVLWSGKNKSSWDTFTDKVENHFQRADTLGVNYARSMYNAIFSPFETSDKQVLIELSTELNGLDIYYTFDNTDPDRHTARYSTPLSIPKDATWLRVVTYRGDKPVGKVITLTTKELRERAKGQKRAVGNLNL